MPRWPRLKGTKGGVSETELNELVVKLRMLLLAVSPFWAPCTKVGVRDKHMAKENRD